MVNCSTVVVTGNSQVADGDHHWDFGDGTIILNGLTQETHIYSCNGTYTIGHWQENGIIICEQTVQINCGSTITITEDTDPCYLDFACFDFSVTACPTDQITWNFGDGNSITCTGCNSVKHCYTNLNTFTGVNSNVTVTATVNGQTASSQLNIAAYDSGVYIGRQGEITDLSEFSLVVPSNVFNGLTQGSPVYVYGTVHIDDGLQFKNVNIFVERSGGFTVDFAKSFTIESSNVSALPDCPCLWRGIDVQSAATFRGISQSSISDALYAVRTYGSNQNPIIGLNTVVLQNNYIGLLANRNFTLEANAGFSGNLFRATATLKLWCGNGENVGDPFWPSGGAYSQDRGWAGVYLNNVHDFNVPATTTAVNQFRKIANGFYIVNSSSPGTINAPGIWNCSFASILRGGYPIAIGGHGIYFLDTQGSNVLNQRGLGMDAIPTFSGCEVGVYAESQSGNTQMRSRSNFMDAMEIGYWVRGITGSISSRITQNRINSNTEYDHHPAISAGVWIEDRVPQSKQHTIDENVITVDQPTEPFTIGVFIQGSFDVNGTVNTVSVGNNVDMNNAPGISVINGAACVQVTQYGGVDVHNNVMLAQQNSGVQLFGTAFFGGQGNSARCNYITGADPANITISNFSGIRCNSSMDATIQDNDVENFENGIAFGANSGNVTLRCNALLGTQDVGLLYSTDAVTGPQINRGNRWLGTYNTWAAQHQQPANLLVNEFRARQNTDEWPPSIDPQIGWFSNSTVVPTCPAEIGCENPPGTTMMSALTELDNLIASGSSGTEDGLLWDLEKYLYARLKENPVVWEGNGLMQNYVNAKLNTPLGQLHEIGEGIKNLYKIDGATQAELDANSTAMSNKRTAIEAIEVTLASTAPGSQYDLLVQQRQVLVDELTALILANASIYADLKNVREQAANGLLESNNAITTSAVYQANEKSFFGVYLNTVGKDAEVATNAQLETLEAIANQCPAEGGRAVYWAIGLYGQLTGQLLEVKDCSNSSAGREQAEYPAKEGEMSSGFTLFPNPADGPCTVVLNIKDDQTGFVILFDALGRELNRTAVSPGLHNMRLSDVAAGNYFVTLMLNDGTSQTIPFVKR